VQNWFVSSSASLSSMVLICVSVKRKLGNLGLFLIVVATGLQNAVAAAATTTSTALLGGWILSLFWFPSIMAQ
jgi:hypothetical protein